MDADLKKRAKAALHDYAILLREHGDASDSTAPSSSAPSSSASSCAPGPTKKSRPSQSSPLRVESAGLFWYRRKLVEWKRAGRLTADGRLRVRPDPDPPWTLARLKRAAPWMKTYDALAVLTDLDGVVEEDFMDAHRNIRLTLEEMIDVALERKLADKLEAVFGRVLEEVRADAPIPKDELSTNNVGARKQLKCSKCGQPGHRAPTCSAGTSEAPKFRCEHCSSLQPGNPVTPAVPPAQFHQGDPSFKADPQ